jgi:hypothetical protein
MARKVGLGMFGLAIVLLAVLIIVPFLKRTFPQFYEGFQNTLSDDARVQMLLARGQADSAHNACIGVTCPEGQFCQEAKCIPIYPGPGAT